MHGGKNSHDGAASPLSIAGVDRGWCHRGLSNWATEFQRLCGCKGRTKRMVPEHVDRIDALWYHRQLDLAWLDSRGTAYQ